MNFTFSNDGHKCEGNLITKHLLRCTCFCGYMADVFLDDTGAITDVKVTSPGLDVQHTFAIVRSTVDDFANPN